MFRDMVDKFKEYANTAEGPPSNRASGQAINLREAYLDPEGFAHALTDLGFNPTLSRRAFEVMDEDGSRSLELNEFLEGASMILCGSLEDKIDFCFKLFDKGTFTASLLCLLSSSFLSVFWLAHYFPSSSLLFFAADNSTLLEIWDIEWMIDQIHGQDSYSDDAFGKLRRKIDVDNMMRCLDSSYSGRITKDDFRERLLSNRTTMRTILESVFLRQRVKGELG